MSFASDSLTDLYTVVVLDFVAEYAVTAFTTAPPAVPATVHQFPLSQNSSTESETDADDKAATPKAVTDNYLTTGVHHYNYTKFVPSDGTATGTITFLTPEAYPHCLWEGKTIAIQEGDHIVGYATITKVLNPLLLCNNIDQKN